jgi:hypothetical protein
MTNTKTGFNLPDPMLASFTLNLVREEPRTTEVPARHVPNLDRFEELGIVMQVASLRGGQGGYVVRWRLTTEGKQLLKRSRDAASEVLNGR